MEDFWYILIGVGYLVYSIYSSNKKQKNKQQQITQQPYQDSDEVKSTHKSPTMSLFDEFFGTYDMVNTDVNESPEYKTVQEKNETEIIDIIPKEEGVSTTKISEEQKIKENVNMDEVLSEIESVDEQFDYEFELKDAIIFSEILNPPYIEK